MTTTEKQLVAEIKKSQLEKKEQFLNETKGNSNKRLYQQKLVIEWVEVIEVDKNALRYEENEEDEAYNQELMKTASTNYGVEALQIAKQIQDNPKFSVENFAYAGRPYSSYEEKPKINVAKIDLSDMPEFLKKAIVNGLENASNCCGSCDKYDEAETGDKADDDFLNGKTDELPEGTQEISQEQAASLAN